MNRVVLDRSAVVLSPTGAPESRPVAVPGATEALTTLTETVDSVVVLTDPDTARALALPDGVDATPRPPADLGAGDWYLTADPETLQDRPAGAKTMLIGPRRPAGPVPLPRIDGEARDLGSAVIEILTHQAMDGTRTG